jgi:hypothetical protein
MSVIDFSDAARPEEIDFSDVAKPARSTPGLSFDPADVRDRLNQAYRSVFGKDIRVSSFGNDETHRRMGIPHEGRFDIGINQGETPEQVRWIAEWLKGQGIPHTVWDKAVPGKSTAPHIHVGPPGGRGPGLGAAMPTYSPTLIGQSLTPRPEIDFATQQAPTRIFKSGEEVAVPNWAGEGVIHIIAHEGDTLEQIARTYKITPEELIRLNSVPPTASATQTAQPETRAVQSPRIPPAEREGDEFSPASPELLAEQARWRDHPLAIDQVNQQAVSLMQQRRGQRAAQRTRRRQVERARTRMERARRKLTERPVDPEFGGLLAPTFADQQAQEYAAAKAEYERLQRERPSIADVRRSDDAYMQRRAAIEQEMNRQGPGLAPVGERLRERGLGSGGEIREVRPEALRRLGLQPAQIAHIQQGGTLSPEGRIESEEETRARASAPRIRARVGSEPISTSAHAFGQFLSGVAEMPAGVLDAIAITAYNIDRHLPEGLQSYRDASQAADLVTAQWAQAIREAARRHYPTDPARQEEFIASTIPQAIGSAVGFASGGLISKSAYVVPALLGVTMGMSEGYRDAKRHGANEDDATLSALLNGGVGASEVAGVGTALRRLDRISGGTLKKALIEMGKETFEESVQEFFQTAAGNVIARKIVGYDKSREWTDGIYSAAGAGGATGALFSAIVSAATGSHGGRIHRGSSEAARANTEPADEGLSSDALPDQIAPATSVEGQAENAQPSTVRQPKPAQPVTFTDTQGTVRGGTVEELTPEDGQRLRAEGEAPEGFSRVRGDDGNVRLVKLDRIAVDESARPAIQPEALKAIQAGIKRRATLDARIIDTYSIEIPEGYVRDVRHGQPVYVWKGTQSAEGDAPAAARGTEGASEARVNGAEEALLPQPSETDAAPVPESSQTIEAQLESARDENSPRVAVFYPKSSPEPGGTTGFIRVPVPDGLLLVKRTKARAMGLTSIKSIQDYVAQNGFEPLIGKVAPVTDTSVGPALRTEDAEGRELSTSIVPTEADAIAQAEVDRRQFPQTANQELLSAQEAAQRRVEENGLSESNAGTDSRGGKARSSDGASGVRRDFQVSAGAPRGDGPQAGQTELLRPTAEGNTLRVGDGRERSADSLPAASETQPPRQWRHADFGLVTESSNQSGVGQNRVRVTDDQGTEHIVQQSNGRGEGNRIMVPVRTRQGLRIAPKESNAPQAEEDQVQASQNAETTPTTAIKEPTLDKSAVVRQTVVRPEAFNALPVEKRQRASELIHEYQGLHYIDPSLVLPDQWARTSERQKRHQQNTLLRVFAIERELKELLKPEAQIQTEVAERELSKLDSRQVQLGRQKKDLQSMFARQLQSPRPNRYKTTLALVDKEIAELATKRTALQSQQPVSTPTAKSDLAHPAIEVPQALKPLTASRQTRAERKRQAKIDKAANRKPRQRQAPDPKKHSLRRFVQLSGGVKGEGEELKRLSQKELGKPFLVNKNSRFTVEQMAQAAYDAGYLRDIPDIVTDAEYGYVDPDKFLEAVENDARGIASHLSTENPIFEEIAALGEVSAEEEKLLEREARFMQDKDAAEMLAEIERTGEISSQIYDDLVTIGATYGLDEELIGITLRSLREIALARLASQDEASSDALLPQSEPAIFAEEVIDETEPEGEADTSFDFGENGAPQSSRKLSDYYQPEQGGLGFREAESGLFAEGGARPVERFEPPPNTTREEREYAERYYKEKELERSLGKDNVATLAGLQEDDVPPRVRRLASQVVKSADRVDTEVLADTLPAPSKLAELDRSSTPVSDYVNQPMLVGEKDLTSEQERLLAEIDRTGKLPSGLIEQPGTQEIANELNGLFGDGPLKMAQAAIKKITDTPEFKRWFAGSKVVDGQGRPLVVYHGTLADFTEFDLSKFGQTDSGSWGKGIYLSKNPDKAAEYALGNDYARAVGRPNDGTIMPVFVRIEKPITPTALDRIEADLYRNYSLKSGETWQDAIRGRLISEGYDGVYSADSDRVMVLHPDQIKSATGNRGTFSLSDPNILKMASVEQSRLRTIEHASDFIPSASSAREENIVTVNAEGGEVIRRALVSKVQDLEDAPTLDGLFLEPSQVRMIVKTLQGTARDMRDPEMGWSSDDVKPLNDLAGNLLDAAREGKGTAVIKFKDAPAAAEPHESFHAGSYLGAEGRVLEDRHTKIEELESHPAVSAWRNYYSSTREYMNASRGLAIEETAATIAGGDYAKLGLSDEEAANYLELWTRSFIERNGPNAFSEFKRQESHVRQAIENAKRAYNSSQADGESSALRESDQAGRRVAESPGGGTQGRDKEVPSGAEGEAREVRARALPSTLRTQGLRAADELYEVYPNKAALLDGKRLLEQIGFDAAESLLKSGQALGAEHIALSKMMQRALLSEAFATIDAEEASALRARAEALASTLAAAFTKAGQAIQAAQIADNSVEDVMATAARVARERGRELSEKEAARIHRAGEELESASAVLAVAGAEASGARAEVEQSRKLIGWAEEGALTMAEIDTLRKRLASLRDKEKRREDRLKELEGLLPERARKPRSGISVKRKAVELLAVDEADLMASVRASLGLGDVPLKMARRDKMPPMSERQPELMSGKEAEGQTGTSGRLEIEDAVSRFKRAYPNTKLTDRRGNPVTLYHGTTGAVEAFDLTKADPEASYGRAVYLTTSEKDASKYATDHPDRNVSKEGARVLKLFANLENPFRPDISTVTLEDLKRAVGSDSYLLSNIERNLGHIEADTSKPLSGQAVEYAVRAGFKPWRGAAELQKVLRNLGYDGVIYNPTKELGKHLKERGSHVVVFDPTNVVFAEGSKPSDAPTSAAQSNSSHLLKMAQVEESVRPLDEDTIDNLAKLGALKLLRAERGRLSVSAWKRVMLSDFGRGISSDLDRIHAKSVKLARQTIRQARHDRAIRRISERPGNEELSRDELEDIYREEREERKRLAAVQAEHEKAAREFEKGPKPGRIAGLRAKLGPKYGPRLSDATGKKEGPRLGEDLKRRPGPLLSEGVKSGPPKPTALDRAIARNALTHIDAIAATKLSRGLSPGHLVSEMMADHGLTATEARTAFMSGGEVLERARAEVTASREMAAALKKHVASTETERDQALASLQEARRARQEAGRRVARELDALKKSPAQRIVGTAWRASKGIPISLMASGEVSNLLRQGGVPSVMQPQLFPAFVKATTSSIRDAGFARNIDVIEQDPDFPLMQRMGIDFSFAGGNKGEEFFEDADVLQRIPIIKQTLGTFVRKSDQVFGGGLDHLRHALGKLWIDELRAKGVGYKDNPRAYKDVGRFINIVTGRADIGDHNTAATKAYLALGRMIGFAPRYRVSRLQFLTLPLNPSFWHAPPEARRIVYKNTARWWGTMAATFGALATLGWITNEALISLFDPDDDDWMKFKYGKIRIDLSAGNATHARTVLRLMMEAYRGLTGQVTGQMAFDKVIGEGADSIMGRWLHSGADPRASLMIEAATGETFDRRPFTWFGDYGIDGAIGTRLTPITYQNFFQTGRKEGFAYGAAQAGAEAVGLSANVYPDRADEPKTRAEKLAMRFVYKGERATSKKPDQETLRKLDELKTRSRRGEDVSREVIPLVASGVINENRGETIIKARSQTYLQEKFRLLSLEDARHVYSLATPAEQLSLKPILEQKEARQEEKDRKALDAAANPERAEIKRARAAKIQDRKRRRQELRANQ